jgi:hypothetical protein
MYYGLAFFKSKQNQAAPDVPLCIKLVEVIYSEFLVVFVAEPATAAGASQPRTTRRGCSRGAEG